MATSLGNEITEIIHGEKQSARNDIQKEAARLGNLFLYVSSVTPYLCIRNAGFRIMRTPSIRRRGRLSSHLHVQQFLRTPDKRPVPDELLPSRYHNRC